MLEQICENSLTDLLNRFQLPGIAKAALSVGLGYRTEAKKIGNHELKLKAETRVVQFKFEFSILCLCSFHSMKVQSTYAET